MKECKKESNLNIFKAKKTFPPRSSDTCHDVDYSKRRSLRHHVPYVVISRQVSDRLSLLSGPGSHYYHCLVQNHKAKMMPTRSPPYLCPEAGFQLLASSAKGMGSPKLIRVCKDTHYLNIFRIIVKYFLIQFT